MKRKKTEKHNVQVVEEIKSSEESDNHRDDQDDSNDIIDEKMDESDANTDRSDENIDESGENSDGSDENSDGSDENYDERVEDEDEIHSDPHGTSNGNYSEPPTKKARINKKDLYKPPTNDELNDLKETENLFQSSLFKMQISELLNEVRLKDKRRKHNDEVVKTLKKFLVELPEGKEHELQDQHWLPKKIKVPIIQSPKEVKGKFHFVPPKEVKVIGSYLTDTCVKPDISVDLAVVMPMEGIQNKDHLNHRYLRKRALYLTVIAKHLRKSPNVQELKFTYHHGNSLKPLLEINWKGESNKHTQVLIHVVPEEKSFKLNRFHVNKNNVRRQWYYGTSESVNEDSEASQPATPFYNTSVLTDLTMQSNSEHLLKMQEGSVGIKEGVSLLKVWLHQRELSQGYGGFSGFIMSMYVSYLSLKKKINKLMSSYQIFRNTLISLSKSDWTRDGISLCSNTSDTHVPDMVEFHSVFDVVFVDLSGYNNICSHLSKPLFFRVQQEAKLAVDILEGRNIDSFMTLFMTPVPFVRKFDNFIHIKNLEELELSADKLNLQDAVLDRGGNYVQACLPSVVSLIQKALHERITHIQVKLEPPQKWDISESPPEYHSIQKITIGFLLNPEFCTNVLDKGPPADSQEAKEFREFWGEKSELRRFKDGSICEAVMWLDSAPICKKRQVCFKVIRHILKRHIGISPKFITCIGNQLDTVLKLPVHIKDSPIPYGTGEEQHQTIIQSYDKLCKLLRNLSDLPLTINSIQGSSPVFRYSEVFPALPSTCKCPTVEDDERLLPSPDLPCPPWTPVMKVICVLEGSGKWPDEKEAFRRLKAAFHIKLGEILHEKHSLPVNIHPGYVDVKKDDFVYRVELAYIREIALLKMVKTPDGMLKMRDNEESLHLEKEIVALPKLTSTLHGVQQQNNTYSASVRLAKRWISSHMLSDYVADEAVELLMTHIYICPAPYNTPHSPIVSFLRFLYLLSHHDWKFSALMVNLNNEFTKEDFTEIPSKFSKERSTLPLMFISTPYDKYSSHWTKKSPTGPVLQRLILLAKESLNVVEKQLMEVNSGDIDYKQIFRPPLEMYDVIIHLRTKQLARQHQVVDLTDKVHIPLYSEDSIDESIRKKFPVYEYDPVEFYLSELRGAYDDYALFFHDKYGGNLVAVLWKPSAFQAHEFKVSHIAATMPKVSTGATKTNVQLVPNVEAIIEDFRIIGGGLVESIKCKTEQWNF